jgi:hypothetical protein
MTKTFAEDLVYRLNSLLGESENIRNDISRLAETRVSVSDDTLNHRTMQVLCDEAQGNPRLGFIGLLNGLMDEGYVIGIVAPDKGERKIIAFAIIKKTESHKEVEP